MSSTLRLQNSVAAFIIISLALTIPASVSGGQIDEVLATKLQSAAPMEKVPIIIYLRDQVDLESMENLLSASVRPGERVPVELRYRTIITALQNTSEQTQAAFLQQLGRFESEGNLSDIQRFWIRNIIVAHATPHVVEEIASLTEVKTIYFDSPLERDVPVSSFSGDSNPESSEPGLRAINAHKLWELGYTGAGRLVMSIDTGVNGNNQSFNTRWRGAQPGILPTWAWFDPTGGTPFPGDCDGHGTHTMGTMCGLYAATNETLGVAPAAHWIASNSLCGGGSHTSRSIASFQWAANPDSNINTMSDVPDVISNSWFDPNVATTQCNPDAGGYAAVIEAVEALGTAVVFSAGNNGPGASTVTPPKNRLRTAVDVFAVGAVDGNNPSFPIASFSSRGPSTCAGPDSLRIKPEVSAPGVSVRSASGTSGTSVLSGTSMASPHVAGAIALLRSVAPFLTGTELKYILMNTAVDLGTAGEDNTYGHGIIDVWAAFQQLPLNRGFVTGQVTSGGNPLSGVSVDFSDPVQQLAGTSDTTGFFIASARIDTPLTSATYTIRAQKFGYLMYSDTITIVLDDTVSRNINLSPAPSGTLQIHAHRNDLSGIGASVRVLYNGQTVVNDSTNSTSGNFSGPLPAGSYTVVVDPPSPYATRAFAQVTITAGQTTMIDALVQWVIEISPTSLSDTVVVDQTHSKSLILTNTTDDSVSFILTDDNALLRIQGNHQTNQTAMQAIELPKDAIDGQVGPPVTDGRGGPDSFGYVWIDSDEPDGPAFNWTDITAVGTQITTWTSGTADDGSVILPLPFPFSFYGSNYTSMKVCTNGWTSFDVASTSNAFSNVSIPATGQPNLALYGFWDDLDLRTQGTVHYYHDAGNGRFVVQYTNVPHYATSGAGLYTFQIIINSEGQALYQYLSMQQTLNSATIGFENATGTVGLQTVYNNTYMHDSLAILVAKPNAPWLSENPNFGVIPANSSINIQVTFDAGGLTVGTTYYANIFVDPDHSDVVGTIPIPASLTVVSTVSVDESLPGLPEEFDLAQNFPNPFNPITRIDFALPEESNIKLTIYNMLGQEIIALVSEGKQAGFYNATWVGTNSAGRAAGSGMYLYRLEATGVSGKSTTMTKKMLLLK